MQKILMKVRESAKEMKNIRALIGSALLISLSLVLDRLFTIRLTPTLHINFSFLTKAVTGMLYGPVVGLYAGALNDIIAYVAYPKGAFFVGFTVSAAVTGLIYGVFLYKNRVSWWRVIVAQTAVTVIVNLFLNTLWLSILYQKAAIPLFAARFLKNIMMLPIETILVLVLTGAVIKAFRAKMRE